MTISKRNEVNFSNAIKVAAIFAVISTLSACGDDSGSSSNYIGGDGREVATVVDMGRCTNERDGDTVYVAEKMKDYLCKNRSWMDLSEISDSEQLSSSSSFTVDENSAVVVNSSSSSVASAKSSSLIITSNKSSSSGKFSAISNTSSVSSSINKVDSMQDFIRENFSVTGVAQKGPFKFGSPLNLYELKNDMNPSGRVYKDEINSNKGDFVIPKVSLAFPYAKLEVRGLYRNEVTGEWSKDSMTLCALTDFSDKRTEANINLLTHLEYDRVLYLVQEKGYSVYAAKKQAAQEIMTAFEFAPTVTCSEDFSIFQNEGVSAGTAAGNGTLLAVSALVMAERNDVEIQSVIDKFREDFKVDGEWNDLQTKADMADWTVDFDYAKIRAAVKSWNILDIPNYETYLEAFWNNVYGLGGCSAIRKDVVASNRNKLSKYFGKYFICTSNKWIAATTDQKDTYGWSGGKKGECKKGNVTDSIYVYNGSKWEFSEREMSIGLCEKRNAGMVSKYENVYYICKDDTWTEATPLEYDTYGLTGGEGDVKTGIVNKDKYYVYENGAWHDVISMIDSRDSQIYKTVVIGSQIWMAQNLNYNMANSYCYKDSIKYCTKYGRLYTWAATKTACPTGWHLPTEAEFQMLLNTAGGSKTAGSKLKSTSSWFDSGNGSDTYSFSAMPAGGRFDQTYQFESLDAYFWSSTEYENDAKQAYIMHLFYDQDYVYLSSFEKSRGLSVRCVKD